MEIQPTETQNDTLMEITPIEIPNDIKLLAVKAEKFNSLSSAIEDSWKRLETHIPLAGRRPYGLNYCNGDELEYYACVQEVEDGEGKESGLLLKIIPKGKYFSTTLSNFKERIPEISQHFKMMDSRADVGRPMLCVEMYSGNDVDLLVNRVL